MIFFIPLVSLLVLASAQNTPDDIRKLSKELEAESTNYLSHGFGDEINWVPWEDARDIAKVQRKPIFLLVHKSWCHACQALKVKFQQKSAQKQFKKLAKYFVMVNAEDDDEPWEEEFAPDGKYIPRTLFISPDGDLMGDVNNPKAEYANYKYYYTNPGQLFMAMQTVMKDLGLGKDVKITYKEEEEAPQAPAPAMEEDEAKPPAVEPPTSRPNDKKEL